jgi:SAM-dependent methyltransferase
MEEVQPLDTSYAFGADSEAIQRLQTQGELLNPFTRRLLEDAGVTRGMRVLDVGCGPGDVSLIAADIVGVDGLVIGVDENPDALRVARARARVAGLSHLSFVSGDIREVALTQEFDAIVGRLILQHVPDPAALLRLLTQRLRPGGLIAFQEYDLTTGLDQSFPPSPLWSQARTWCITAMQRYGLEPQMGMKLHPTFLAAGLPAPHLRYEAAIGSGPVWAGQETLSNTVRVLMPLILQFGIATTEEIGIETLTKRLREETASRGGVARLPGLVSAWAHAPVS